MVSRVLGYRPAADTAVGAVALLIACAWSASVMQATSIVSTGLHGARSNLSYVIGETGELDNPFVDTAVANCPAGESVIAGGAWTNNAALRVVVNAPSDDHRYWIAGVSNQVPFDTVDAQFRAYAICAKPGVPVVAPG